MSDTKPQARTDWWLTPLVVVWLAVFNPFSWLLIYAAAEGIHEVGWHAFVASIQ